MRAEVLNPCIGERTYGTLGDEAQWQAYQDANDEIP